MNKRKQNFIFVAVLGLTLVSVLAGFELYNGMFNLVTAILCSVIFETIRVGCLWSLAVDRWTTRIVAVPVYVLVTLTCAFASVTSFHAKIVASHDAAMRPLKQEHSRRIDLIKRAYAKEAEIKLAELDGKIDICRQNLAKDPSQTYWKNRLDQRMTDRGTVVAARDSLLHAAPVENAEVWINAHAAILGLELKPVSSIVRGSLATTRAVTELWGISELTAKKIVSVIIVVTTECGILLLALLAGSGMEPYRTPNGKRLFKRLKAQFDHDEIKSFLEKCRAAIEETGKLPLTRQLSKKQRELHKIMSRSMVDLHDIEEMLNQCQVKSKRIQKISYLQS